MNGTTRARIAFVITGLGQGGAENMLYTLLRSIDRSRFEPHVFSLTGGGPFQKRLSDIHIPTFVGREAFGLISAPRYDVVQGWMYHGNIGATVAALLTRQRPSLVWNVRASLDDPSSLKPLTRALIRLSGWMSSIPQRILFNSTRGHRQHVEMAGYATTHSMVIPNGFDCTLYAPDDSRRRAMRESLGVGAERILVGLVARFHPMKDHATFFKAAALLQRRVPGAVFVLAGTGMEHDNPQVAALIRDAGLTDGVKLLGARNDMPAIVNALDIATCSSTGCEGFPNSIGEAMASAVPCVVTDVGDCAVVVGDTGFVIPPRNPEALASAWKRMIDMEQIDRRTLGNRARDRVLAHYSIAAIAKQYEDLYNELIATHRR